MQRRTLTRADGAPARLAHFAAAWSRVTSMVSLKERGILTGSSPCDDHVADVDVQCVVTDAASRLREPRQSIASTALERSERQTPVVTWVSGNTVQLILNVSNSRSGLLE